MTIPNKADEHILNFALSFFVTCFFPQLICTSSYWFCMKRIMIVKLPINNRMEIVHCAPLANSRIFNAIQLNNVLCDTKNAPLKPIYLCKN